jgi:hypothetical protein
MSVNSSVAFQLGAQEESQAGPAQEVTWHLVTAPGTTGVTVSSDSGTFDVTAGRAVTPLDITAHRAGDVALTFDLTQAGTPLPHLTLDVDVSS